MEALGRLIGELRAGGELDSRGEFTLDRDRAREKMRQFQLTDPRSYVLELVQAAVLAGATEARFEIDADDMRMSFDGRPFTALDFEELYSSMFTRRSSLARRQLALGLNSAMALAPRVLRVESGTARMEMRPGADEITTAAEAVDGTRIHVKDRFGNATLVRFVLKLRGHITEMLYLEERCRWTALAIHLNGERISGGEPLAEAAGRVERLTAEASIVAGFARERRPARLMILDQGVWIATHQLDRLPFQFVAYVESARLLKDASQRNVVRNRAYRSVRAAVSVAFYQALAKLAGEDPSEEMLFRRLLLHPATLPLIRRSLDTILGSGAGLLAAAGDEPPEGRAMAAVPLWPSARRPPLDLSLLDLLRLRASRGRVGWTDDAYPDLERKDQPPVAVISAPEERNYLAELFGDGFYCADSELQHELVRWRNVLRWRRRRMTPEIPASAGSLISMPLATAEIKGEVGIFLDPFRQSEGQGRFPVWWIKDGGLLQKAVVTPIVHGFTAALEADFEPAENFARVEVDRLFVRVVIAIARALGPLMNRLAAESRRLPGLPELIRGCLISYLGIDWNRDGLADHLKGFGITDEEHLSYARSLVEEDPVATISAADLAGEEAPAMARLPLFATMQGRPPIAIGSDPGRRLTLRDIARGGKNWRYLPGPHSGLRTSAEDNVLLLDDVEIAVFRQVFPGVTLRDHSRDYHRPAAFARHMSARRWPLAGRSRRELAAEPAGRVALSAEGEALVEVALTGEGLRDEVALTGEGLRGEVALRDEPGEPDTARVAREAPVWDGLHPREAWLLQKPLLALRSEGLLQGEIEADDIQGYVGLRAPNPTGIPVHAELQLLKYNRPLDTVRYEVPIGPIAGMINDDQLTPAADWQGVVDDDRLARVRRLVLEHAARLLVESCGAPGVSPALRAILVNTAARVLATDAVDQPWAEELVAALETAPLFARVDGQGVDLSRIREVLARNRQVYVLVAESDGVEREIQGAVELAGDRFVLRLSGDEHQALAAIFGAEALIDARPWLRHRQAIRRIAALEPVERLELGRDEALVATAVHDAAPTGASGEVGLRRQPDKHGLELRLYKNGRLYDVRRAEASYCVVAVVEDDALQLDEHGLFDLGGPRLAELAEICRLRIPDLIAELVADPSLWDGPSREVARIHLIDYLAATSAFESRQAKELQAACDLPAFDTPTGPCSFVDLCRSYADFDRQAYLLRSESSHGQPLDPRRRVLLVSRREANRLRRLFPVLEDYGDRWAEEQKLRRRLENAPAFTVEPPERPLVSGRSRGRHDLRTHLWLPAELDAKLLCAFGFAGKQLNLSSFSDLFPCAGVVTGEWLVAMGGRVTPDQREGLERSAFQLYKQLAKDLTRPSRGSELSGDRARAARRLLNHARTALLDRLEEAGHGLDDGYVELLHQLEGIRLSEQGRRDQHEEAMVDPEIKTAEETVVDPEIKTAETGVAEPAITGPETRDAKLLHALHVELSCARELHAELLDEKNLDRILLSDLDRDVIARCFDHGVVVNRRHRLVRRLLESHSTDRVLATFLASAVYSAMNHFWQEIEDDHEREFHRELVGALLERGSV